MLGSTSLLPAAGNSPHGLDTARQTKANQHRAPGVDASTCTKDSTACQEHCCSLQRCGELDHQIEVRRSASRARFANSLHHCKRCRGLSCVSSAIKHLGRALYSQCASIARCCGVIGCGSSALEERKRHQACLDRILQRTRRIVLGSDISVGIYRARSHTCSHAREGRDCSDPRAVRGQVRLDAVTPVFKAMVSELKMCTGQTGFDVLRTHPNPTRSVPCSAAAEAARTATFEARVQLPPPAAGAASAASTASLVVTGPDGGTAHAYVDRSGRVIVPALSAGAHLVDVAALGYVFHQYRLDVRPGAAGSPFALSTVGGAAPLPPPYTLVPIGHASYYVKRKPVNLRGLILSPYGLMAGTRPARTALPRAVPCPVPAANGNRRSETDEGR